eukprot:m.15385 g.15385  ORF g.15385 m.15385 type:complete len:148 (+) comp4464_c0_seq1:40-483(+)
MASFDLDNLLEQFCIISCNPSSLQQRLVRGGRNADDHLSKMVDHKKDCMIGCTFARTADNFVKRERTQKVSKFMDTLTKNNDAILSSSEIRERKEVIQDWFLMMRQNCADRCSEYCNSKKRDTGSQRKCERSCFVGCDKFFDSVFED